MTSAWPRGYRFDELSQVPAHPGLYAWYHELHIPQADVSDLVASMMARSDIQRRGAVESFLHEHIFDAYREADYDVLLRGKLKPEYAGRVTHAPKLSDQVAQRLADKPELLMDLKGILQRATPFFSSPIYIGIAKTSLRQRLMTHQRLLLEYRESSPASLLLDDPDHSFAYEAVCVRRLPPLELIVYVMETPVDPDAAGTAEYILNRINYPLCGRN